MLRLSKLTDYAVVLLTQIVREGVGLSTTSRLAEETGLPHPTVSKILKTLAKGNILKAQRGSAGGYELARVAKEINIADIITVMDGPIQVTECASQSEHDCQLEGSCPVLGKWHRVNRAIRDALESVSLEEMAQDAVPLQFKIDAA